MDRDAADYISNRAKNADVEEAIALLRRPREGEPPQPGDELPEGWKPGRVRAASKRESRPATRSKSPK